MGLRSSCFLRPKSVDQTSRVLPLIPLHFPEEPPDCVPEPVIAVVVDAPAEAEPQESVPHSEEFASRATTPSLFVPESSFSSRCESEHSFILEEPTPTLRSESLRVFKLKQLQIATQNFNERFLLGQGGFGKVYRGILRDSATKKPQEVAIKKLDHNSKQGLKECLAEIQILSRVNHPNLVTLLGFCMDDGEGILVYEFLPLGSLDYHLYDLVEEQTPLTFEERVRIIFQCAEGLNFLHQKRVIHRDFKAGNVVLDKDKNAKLTDFGLSKIAELDKTHNSTTILGTLGYLDPNYMATGRLTKSSDVFSFGVLMLTVLTGKSPTAPEELNFPTLAAWCREFFGVRRPHVEDFIDPLIKDEVMADSACQKLATKLAITARHCVDEVSKCRPSMDDIVESLKRFVIKYESSKKAAANKH